MWRQNISKAAPTLWNALPLELRTIKTLDRFFSNKSHQDPTFGFYNLAHSNVTVFHSFKPKVEKIFMNSNE